MEFNYGTASTTHHLIDQRVVIVYIFNTTYVRLRSNDTTHEIERKSFFLRLYIVYVHSFTEIKKKSLVHDLCK